MDDLTPLVEATTQVHELFISLMAGGFTEMQALHMLGVFMASAKAEA